MPRQKIKKTDRTPVGDADLKEAVSKVINDRMSIRIVADMYNMKKSTLGRYVKLNKNKPEVEIPTRNVPNKVFSEKEESELEVYLMEASRMNHGLTTVDTRKLAFQYASALGLKIPNNWVEMQQAGPDWLYGFMQRHKRLSIRAPEATSLSRATSFNRVNVETFYQKLESVLAKFKFEPHRIFNLDETGCTTVQRPPNIIAQKGCKQVSQITSAERGTLVTLCCFINASGGTIPPVFIFPRAKVADYMSIDAPSGSLICVHKSGWMTSDNFFKVICHFVKYSHATKEDPVLVLLDNHESHISIETIRYAKDNGVVMLTFPPHCSHRLQPLDVAVYGPFKKRYNTALNEWMLSNPGRTVSLYQIPSLVNKALLESFTPKNILSGFAKTGIHPFNSTNFDETDYLSSYVTDRPMDHPGENPNDSLIVDEPNNETRVNEEPENNSETETPDNTISSGINKSQTTSESHPGRNEITPSTVRPFPKAMPRKLVNRGRKRGRCRILTETPEKTEIEMEHERKLLKLSVKKAVFRKDKFEKENYVPQEDTDTDDQMSLHDSSDEDIDLEFYKMKPNDFVLVKFSRKKSVVCYVGVINELNIRDKEARVNFLRRKNNSNKFFHPEKEDESWVDKDDIMKVLLPVDHEPLNERSAKFISFSDDSLKSNYIIL